MSSAPPLVSVIIPTYNRAHLLKPAICSVLEQSFTDFELIVMDDGSTDRTAELVSAMHDPRVHYHFRDKRGGAFPARNSAMTLARGTYLAFNDSDDRWLPQKLEIQVAALERAGEDCAGVICGMRRGDHARQRLIQYAGAELTAGIRQPQVLATFRRYLHVQSWLVRRSAVIEAGMFDESFPLYADWELLVRLTEKRRMLALPEIMVRSYSYPDSVTATATSRKAADALARIVEKHGDRLQTVPGLHQRMHYAWGRVCLLEGRYAEAGKILRSVVRREPARLRGWLLLLLCAMRARALFGFVLRKRVYRTDFRDD